MRKTIFMVLYLFFLVDSCLYAFSNSDFKVSDNGWRVETKGDREVNFFLKDFAYSGGSGEGVDSEEYDIEPSISVSVTDLKEVIIPEYSEKELNDMRNAVENKAYRELLATHKKTVRDSLSTYSNTEYYKANQMIDEFYKNSGYKNGSITNFGSSKAFCVEFLIGNMFLRRYVIIAYKCSYIIDLCYSSGFPIDDATAFKEFKKTFYVKASSASYFNYYSRQILYNGLWILLIIGVKLIVNHFKSGA